MWSLTKFIDYIEFTMILTAFSLNHVFLFVLLFSRYRFGCREVAIDDEHQVLVFTANENDVTTISLTTTLTIAVVSEMSTFLGPSTMSSVVHTKTKSRSFQIPAVWRAFFLGLMVEIKLLFKFLWWSLDEALSHILSCELFSLLIYCRWF